MTNTNSPLFTIRHSLPPKPPYQIPKATYEDNTYIDWMKEAIQPPSGSLKKWSVLVLMAIAVGYMTVVIDLFSAGLNDFKIGICFSKLDRWSLLSPYLTCPSEDWYSWLRLLAGDLSEKSWLSFLIDLPIYIVSGSIFILAAGYLTYKKAPLAKQSGIPEIKLIVAGLNYHTSTYLGTQALFVKAAGLVMVVASGLWLGKEGPLAHVACSILSALFDRIYGKDGSEGLRRELLVAATATGIAVAFNSPIGGVLFVSELLQSYFSPMKIMWNSFVAATIALVVVFGSKAFTEGTNFHEGNLFEVLFGNFSWLFTETLPFIFLGLAGGLFGHVYTQLYLKFENKQTKNRVWNIFSSMSGLLQTNIRYVEILVVAMVTSLFTFPLSMSKMSLEAYLKLLFTDCPVEEVSTLSQATNFMCDSSLAITGLKLSYIFIGGFVLSAYSYGLSLPGGILMPSLVLGGTLGRLVGILSRAIQSKINPSFLATCTAKSCIVSPSAYAVVGAAAFMTGITKLTVAVVVIIFELTGALTYVVPIMVAVMTAKVFNDWLSEHNIYDAWIVNDFNTKDSAELSEYNLGKGDGLLKFGPMTSEFKAALPDILVSKTMVPTNRLRCIFLYPEAPYSLPELYAYLSDDCHEGYPVIANEHDFTLFGYVTKKTIYESIVRTVGSSQPLALLVSFRTKIPEQMIGRQQDYEKDIQGRYEGVDLILLDLEPTALSAHSKTSLKQVVEIFDRLQLNSLMINEYGNTTKLSGFVDRFILARLVHNKFVSLQHEHESEYLNGYGEEETEFFHHRRDRESIELIS
ncbi:hypothetical protein PUMCH_004280 [Australozyma saopauloensis]|uniref:Chloride channel protein n=1 Tax=Australozyma saopauloensis TaxID=291208 RepID=A0AAX4HE70_9ASCO|nr:hypothetical protein PUMCH_004280 [[Candida] saopauloensis]